MPRIKEYGWHYYHNLKGALKKFENVLDDFEFTTARECLKL